MLAKEYSTQERKLDDALEFISQAIQFDPNIEQDQLVDLGQFYGDVCQRVISPDLAEEACSKAANLAIETEDTALLLKVCLQISAKTTPDAVSVPCSEILTASEQPLFDAETGDFAQPIAFVGSPNFDRRPRDEISAIVMHATGNDSLQVVVGWFNRPNAQSSSHYTIDKDGTIVQHVQDTDRGLACRCFFLARSVKR